MIDSFATKLQKALEGPLPGPLAHQKMTSYKRPDALKAMATVKDARHGSVLVPLYPHRNEVYVSLMLRPKYHGVHSAQVSFPGGRREGKETAEQCALRESNEELGIDPEKVKIIGQLSPVFIPPSRFLVSPFVGILSERPKFLLDTFEVQQLIEIPVSRLFDDAIESEHEIEIAHLNTSIVAPCFIVEEHIIWGATAMMISELKEIANAHVQPF